MNNPLRIAAVAAVIGAMALGGTGHLDALLIFGIVAAGVLTLLKYRKDGFRGN